MKSMNSSVPKLFVSTTPPHAELRVAGRWTDPFAPMVLVSKATARPANIGHLQRPERGNNVIANAARIWNRGIGPDPDAFVESVTQVLSKLSEEVAIDLRAGLGCVDGQMSSFLGHDRHSQNRNYETQT
jgi:hypothetical protein